MDCLCVEAGALGQALCGAAGGSTKRNRDGLGDQNFQQGVDKRSLPNPGPAGDDRHIGDECEQERCSLAVSKRQLRPLLDPRNGLVDINGGPGRLSGGLRLQLLGDFPLGSVKCSKEDATAAFEIVATTAPPSSSRFNAVSTSSAGTSSSFSVRGTSSSNGRPQCPLSVASASA